MKKISIPSMIIILIISYFTIATIARLTARGPGLTLPMSVGVDLNAVKVRDGERELSLNFIAEAGLYCGSVSIAPENDTEELPEISLEYALKIPATQTEKYIVLRNLEDKYFFKDGRNGYRFSVTVPGEAFRSNFTTVTLLAKGAEEDLRRIDLSLHMDEFCK